MKIFVSGYTIFTRQIEYTYNGMLSIPFLECMTRPLQLHVNISWRIHQRCAKGSQHSSRLCVSGLGPGIKDADAVKLETVQRQAIPVFGPFQAWQCLSTRMRHQDGLRSRSGTTSSKKTSGKAYSMGLWKQTLILYVLVIDAPEVSIEPTNLLPPCPSTIPPSHGPFGNRTFYQLRSLMPPSWRSLGHLVL